MLNWYAIWQLREWLTFMFLHLASSVMTTQVLSYFLWLFNLLPEVIYIYMVTITAANSVIQIYFLKGIQTQLINHLCFTDTMIQVTRWWKRKVDKNS
jgi:hypothetical protein